MSDGTRQTLLVGGTIVGVLAVAIGLSALRRVDDNPLVGKAAPPFDLPLVVPAGQQRIRLGDLSGNVVLLDFWASWCPPCRATVPALSRIHERYAGRSVRILGINTETDLDPRAIHAAHRAFGGSYPTLRDPQAEAQQAYRVEALPTLVLVGPDGVVRDVAVGGADEAYLIQAIDELLE